MENEVNMQDEIIKSALNKKTSLLDLFTTSYAKQGPTVCVKSFDVDQDVLTIEFSRSLWKSTDGIGWAVNVIQDEWGFLPDEDGCPVCIESDEWSVCVRYCK